MPTGGLEFWIQIVTVLGAVLAAALWMNRRFNGSDRHLEQIELRLGAVEHQNRALLTAFPSVISSLMSAQLMPPEQGSRLIATALEVTPIDRLLREIQPTTNPFSQDDINRLRGYVERLRQGAWLTEDEAHDFYALSDTLTREYPAKEGSWLLYLIGGILLGLILAGPKKK